MNSSSSTCDCFAADSESPADNTKSAFTPQSIVRAASYTTPQALLALKLDTSRQRLYGAGLDGLLYSVAVPPTKPPAATQPAEANNSDQNTRSKAADQQQNETQKQQEKQQEKKTTTTAADKLWRLHENYVSACDIHGSTLITASYDRTIAWWNLDSGERMRSVNAHDGWVRGVKFLPSGERLVSIGDDQLVKLWNAKSGACEATLAGHSRQSPQGFATAIYALAIHPDGRWIATADRVGECRVWDVNTRETIAHWKAPDFYTYDEVKRARSIGGIRAIAFSADGQQLALGGIGLVTNVDGFVGPCRIEVWDWQAGRRTFAGQGKHQAIQNDLVFGSDSWIISGGGGDGGANLAFWNPPAEAPAHLAKPEGHLHRIALDPPQRRLFTAGSGGFQEWRW